MGLDKSGEQSAFVARLAGRLAAIARKADRERRSRFV
jgi:hypothetical protein